MNCLICVTFTKFYQLVIDCYIFYIFRIWIYRLYVYTWPKLGQGKAIDTSDLGVSWLKICSYQAVSIQMMLRKTKSHKPMTRVMKYTPQPPPPHPPTRTTTLTSFLQGRRGKNRKRSKIKTKTTYNR